jgi:hypothetical protein
MILLEKKSENLKEKRKIFHHFFFLTSKVPLRMLHTIGIRHCNDGKQAIKQAVSERSSKVYIERGNEQNCCCL